MYKNLVLNHDILYSGESKEVKDFLAVSNQHLIIAHIRGSRRKRRKLNGRKKTKKKKTKKKKKNKRNKIKKK